MIPKHRGVLNVLRKNSQKKQDATNIINNNPLNLPVLSKLNTNSEVRRTVDENLNHNLNLHRSLFDSLQKRITNARQNNEYITKLFPDIEMIIQIIVSSILSPKKMTDVQLNYLFNDSINMPETISSEILDEIKKYINTEYKLEDKLPDIVRKALFTDGSYVQVVIPESSVDEVINGDLYSKLSVENYKTALDRLADRLTTRKGFLLEEEKRNPIVTNKISYESVAELIVDEAFDITDNYDVFKIHKVKEAISKSVIKSSTRRGGLSMESREKLNYLDVFRMKDGAKYSQTITVKTKDEASRKTLGKPLTFRINSDAVIPVFTPGDESNHVSYIVLLDENGLPINSFIDNKTISSFNNMVTTSYDGSNTTNQEQNLIQKTYSNLVQDNIKDFNIDQLYDLFKDLLERRVYNSVKNSVYDSNVTIANSNEIFLLMFARALSNQKTNLLFIPAELVTYYAFNYNPVGIGKSLLENVSILMSLRAILLFSKVNSYTKQAIDVTKCRITLDPDDPNPEASIEQIKDAVLKLRQNYLPLGINNPIDLVTWIHRAGLQFEYDAAGLPNVKLDFESSNIDHTIPDSDLEEELKKQTMTALGVSPEMVDNGFSPEFATTVVANNILLSKRISIYQKKLSEHLTKFVSLIIYNDEHLRVILKKIILNKISEIGNVLNEKEKQTYRENKEEFADEFIDRLCENLSIDIPRPENTNISNLNAEFDLYVEGLDKGLASIFSSEVISEDIAGATQEHVESIQNNFKHMLIRKWMANNNYFPELFELASTDKLESNRMIELITTHLSATMRNSTEMLQRMEKYKMAVKKDLDGISGDDTATDSGYSGSSDSGSDDRDSDGTSGVTSDDDFSLDL